MTLYVAREIWETNDTDIANHEQLVGVFTSKKEVEKALISCMDAFYDWYWETYVGEESDHDKDIRAGEYGALFYQIHRFIDYDDNIEYTHEWYPYCLKVDIVEVE